MFSSPITSSSGSLSSFLCSYKQTRFGKNLHRTRTLCFYGGASRSYFLNLNDARSLSLPRVNSKKEEYKYICNYQKSLQRQRNLHCIRTVNRYSLYPFQGKVVYEPPLKYPNSDFRFSCIRSIGSSIISSSSLFTNQPGIKPANSIKFYSSSNSSPYLP